MHLRHLERTLGVTFNIATLTFAHLQEHVTRRSKMKGHHKKALSSATIRKEIAAEKQRVLDVGGLYVLGTERHESRRIDNQLRGRSGRQGEMR